MFYFEYIFSEFEYISDVFFVTPNVAWFVGLVSHESDVSAICQRINYFCFQTRKQIFSYDFLNLFWHDILLGDF